LRIFKEKEMPEFRKFILALAVIALFAGFASAQVGTPTGGGSTQAPLCTTTNGAVTPTLRAEGYTELAGDIVIVCTGGTPPALGTVIPTANITIFLNTAVTSRLLQATTVGSASEALLLIDEPGSTLFGYGPLVPQTPCSTPAVGAGLGGCTEYVGQTTIGGTTYTGVPVSVNPNSITTGTGTLNGQPGGTCTVTTPCYSATSVTPGANVFQGVVSGNAVTFFGIPVLPPTTIGDSRVLRITNIRANANGVTAGGPTPGSVVASISTSGSSSLPITNSTLTVGFVQQGLSAAGTILKNGSNSGSASSTGVGFNQCSGASTANLGILQFQEAFGTAFKTRVSAGIAASGANQNSPGTIYNSESGLVVPITGSTNTNGVAYTAGLADYGTRLKATFNNIPSGVTLFVSTRDVQNNFTTPAGSTQAVLVVSEGSIDTAGNVPASTQTGTFTSGTNTVPIAPVPISAGTGTAVWEIINTNPAQIDSVSFAVYITYSSSPATNTPAAPSTISVTMSFAPTPSGGLFTSSSGAAASNSLTIPRFSDSLDITKSLANFALCSTALLYPYVINVNGFDTGLAIANTTTDPFGTTAQVGTCTLNFYGSTAPAAAFVTPSVATGTVYANLASTLAPGFSGYMIAVCNFQLAHGFAFVSDVGARNLAMGYLALVLTRSGTSPEALNN
jgi:hypothetical protein